MKNLKKSKLLNVVIYLVSMLSVGLILLPIVNELDSFLSNLIIVIVYIIGVNALEHTLKTKINEYILSEIERHKNKHISKFIDFLESDERFKNNVLIKDIPIYNGNNEVIGEQTIYSAIYKKFYLFTDMS